MPMDVSGISNSFPDSEDPCVNTQGCIISITLPPPEVSKALRIPESAHAYRLERLYFIDGKPFSWQVNYLTCENIAGFEKFSGQIDTLHNLYAFLENQYRIRFSSGTETISAIPAGFFDAKLLEIAAGNPLMEFVRTAVFTDGTMEYTRLLTRPDLIRLTVSMDGPPQGNAL